MRIVNKMKFAALAATLLFHTSITRADDNGALRMTFAKRALPDGSGATGTVDGDCGPGTVAVTYLTVIPGKAILRFSTEYSIETSAGCSFKALCDGGMNLRTGAFVLNGLVTEGTDVGAQMQVRGQADPSFTTSTGTITITPTDQRNATITWTKWVTAWFPEDGTGNAANLGGVVGGEVGDGTFTGEATAISVQGDLTIIEADYHFHGSKHSLTVHFQLIQKEESGVITGVVNGVVTDGWLQGNVVVGQYTAGACDGGEGVGLSPCFDGTAEILRGTKNQD